MAPSKYLGDYVAGNLAVRHGIHGRLQNSAGPGVTAIVRLPLSISPESPGELGATRPLGELGAGAGVGAAAAALGAGSESR